MLEKPLLKETKSYYRREAAELHADNTSHAFIAKVQNTLPVLPGVKSLKYKKGFPQRNSLSQKQIIIMMHALLEEFFNG